MLKPLVADRLDEIAALAAGSLEEVPYAVLLAALARSRRTAVVELTRKPVEKRIFLESGSPFDCRSNLVHETFGRFLVAVGKLEGERLHGHLTESLRRQVPLGEVLLEEGVLDPSELYRLLQQCLARKLLDGFTWRKGSFRVIEQRTEEGDRSLKVRAPRLILTGVLKLAPAQEVSAAVRPLFEEPLVLAAGPPFSREDLSAGGPAGAVLAALEAGPLRVDELAGRLAVAPDDLGRALYALSILGFVVPESRRGAAPRSDGEPTRPLRLPGAGHVTETGGAGRDRILEAFLSHRRKDAFELLGLPEAASQADVEEAFLEFGRQHAPWQAATLGPDLAEKARAVFLAGAHAFAELTDHEKRSALLFRRARKREERKAAPPPRIQTDLLDPEVQYRKGLEASSAGDFRRAHELLRYAADLDAQNAVYRAEAAWAGYRASPESARPEATAELEEVLHMDPSCGLAALYLGQIEADAGYEALAEQHLRQAIKLMAPDRRAIEALKRLQSGKRR